MDEVWILEVERQPDYPYSGGWYIHGVYVSQDAAQNEIDRLIKECPHGHTVAYRFGVFPVKK